MSLAHYQEHNYVGRHLHLAIAGGKPNGIKVIEHLLFGAAEILGEFVYAHNDTVGFLFENRLNTEGHIAQYRVKPLRS